MTRSLDLHPTARRGSAIAVSALSAFLLLGALAPPASAQNDHNRGNHRGWDNNDRRRGGWDNGYYRAPPVVYGAPRYYYQPVPVPQRPVVAPQYYYPPPVVYGPGGGLGLNFNFR